MIAVELHGWIVIAYVFVFMILANLVHAKVNRKPRDYVRRGVVRCTPSNLFSEEKWTADGVRYHKKALFFALQSLVVFVLGWALLAVVF
jgi:hypothetical protein